MAFDNKLLEIIACPVCKGKLILNNDKTSLICRFDRLSFSIEDGIPLLLESDATPLSADELETLETK